MTKKSSASQHDLKQAAKKIAAGAVDVHDAVRDLTLEALSHGRIDAARIKEVVTAVTSGVTEGATPASSTTKATLESAWRGLDAALAKSAEAVSLGLDEARGRLGEFAQSDVQRAATELRALEELFIETVSAVGRSADAVARDVWSGLVGHAQRAGTDTGRQARASAEAIQNTVDNAARQGVQFAADVGGNVLRQLAQVASGVLAGVAQKLDQASRPDTPTKKS